MMKDITELDLTDWIGRTETATGTLGPQMAAMAHATLGRGSDAPQEGDAMPPLWHWFAFPATAPMDELGRDGHPKRGGFLPPVPLQRRMWAAGKIIFRKPIAVGKTMTRHSTIAKVAEKHGAAGPMVFVTVQHDIRVGDSLALRERQDIVYLNIADPFVPPPKKPAPTSELVVNEATEISQARLFRYSAITFNAHRIHYDLDYAKSVEKYPGLVVHGPLQANLLVDAATRSKGRAPDSFAFRGIHPMFQGSTLGLKAWREGEDVLQMCTSAAEGHQGMTATAIWEEC